MLKKFLGAAKKNASTGLGAAKDFAAGTVESTKGAVVSSYDATANQTTEFVASYWPRAQKVVVNSLLAIAEDHLKDPTTLTSAFETAHAALPLPVRLAIRQDTFVAFCFSQRDTLSQKVVEYRSSSNTQLLLGSEADSVPSVQADSNGSRPP